MFLVLNGKAEREIALLGILNKRVYEKPQAAKLRVFAALSFHEIMPFLKVQVACIG